MQALSIERKRSPAATLLDPAILRSGSRAPLPEPGPLRTGHDGCPSSGSSLCRPVPDPHVVSMMAPPVYQLQVVDLV
jgi:hypothetical protein